MTRLPRFILLLLTAFLLLSTAEAQTVVRPRKAKGKAKKYLNKGRKQADKGNFLRSIDYYTMSVKADSLTFEAPMELGFTYFSDLKKSDSALVYFRLAERNMPEPPVYVLYYYMGQAYQLNRQYDNAIKYYNIFSPSIEDTPEGAALKLEVLRAIIDCRYARDVDQRRDSIVVVNLGPKVNTPYREHTPVANEGDSILMFTAKRPQNKGSGIDVQDGQFYEDMYIVTKVNGEWTESASPRNVPLFSNLKNTGDHEAFVFLTYDEKKLLTYKKDVLWESNLKNGVFEKSTKMSTAVNIGPSQNHASITADGSTIYFSSNKPGGIGGFDLYRSYKKSDGTWGEAENLGPAVNTKGNEDSPVISPDGSVLYFSSNGLLGYGDYDVFKLEMGADYNTVINMGEPVNSSGTDIFYRLNSKGNHGYFASNRDGGLGDLDIYEVKIFQKFFSNCLPLASKEYPVTLEASKYLDKEYPNAKVVWETGDNTQLVGNTVSHMYKRPGVYDVQMKVVDANGKELVPEKIIEVPIRNVTHIEFFAPDTAVTNSEVLFNGSVSMVKDAKIRKYMWDFGDGKRADSIYATHTYNTGGYYEVKMEVEAFSDSLQKTSVFCVSKYILILSGDAATAWLKTQEKKEVAVVEEPVKKEEPVKPMEPVNPDIISLENVYFDLDKHNIRTDASETLKRNIKTLKENPNVRIIVSAHTDARGSIGYNKALSTRRANSVVEYLKKEGISRKRITSVVANGEKKLANQCGDNVDCDEASHQANRRVELLIVKK